MTSALVLAFCGVQVGFVYGDPSDTVTPVVIASLLPTDRFGDPLPPPLPSVPYVRARVGFGPGTGLLVLDRRLTAETRKPPREFPTVGRAALWQFTYECRVVTPTGPTTVYLDRSLLVIAR